MQCPTWAMRSNAACLSRRSCSSSVPGEAISGWQRLIKHLALLHSGCQDKSFIRRELGKVTSHVSLDLLCTKPFYCTQSLCPCYKRGDIPTMCCMQAPGQQGQGNQHRSGCEQRLERSHLWRNLLAHGRFPELHSGQNGPPAGMLHTLCSPFGRPLSPCTGSSSEQSCALHHYYRTGEINITLLQWSCLSNSNALCDCHWGEAAAAGRGHQCGHEQPGEVPERLPQGAHHRAAGAVQEQLWSGALLLLQAGR